jgi:hypothetical protein
MFRFLTRRLQHMPDTPVDRLRLLAQDEEDLAVLSAHMQDALVRVADMTLVSKTGIFALVGSRFDWLAAGQGRKQRCQVGLHFDRVLKASRKGFETAKPDDVLNLLSMTFTVTDAPAGVVDLVFSGGAAVRLEVECLEGQLRDLGPRWQTTRQPGHAGDSEPQNT